MMILFGLKFGIVSTMIDDLVEKMRQATEKALRRKLLTLEESAMLISRYAQGLAGYTYLHETSKAGDTDPLARAMAKLKGAAEGAPPSETNGAPHGNGGGDGQGDRNGNGQAAASEPPATGKHDPQSP